MNLKSILNEMYIPNEQKNIIHSLVFWWMHSEVVSLFLILEKREKKRKSTRDAFFAIIKLFPFADGEIQ